MYTYPFYDLLSTKQKISRKCKKSKKSGTFRDLGEAHAQYFFHPPHFQRVLEVFPQLLKQVGPRRIRSAKVTDQIFDMCRAYVEDLQLFEKNITVAFNGLR